MADGMTLRDTASGGATDFCQEVASHQTKAVSGLMEREETYFPFSRKGTKGLGDQARTSGGQFKNASLRSKNLVPV